MMTFRVRHTRLPAALAGAMLACLVQAPAQARTLAEVRQLGQISMCANDDALPFASSKPDDPGFQVELGRAVAAGLGLNLGTEWIFPRRRANTVNCDMLFDTVADSKVHEGRLLLSRPYHRSGVALGMSQSESAVNDFREIPKGRKVGVMINSIASVVLGKQGLTTSPYAFETDLVDDLRKGELYGAVVSSARLSYYIGRNPDAGLQLVHAFDQTPDLTWNIAIGLRKSDQALVDEVNQVLGRLLADGTIAAIYAKYGVQHRPPAE
ncbi:MAG: transporter substrate-binding domain-containing protein [Burkholderiales bacterium]|nr:transporter substrate-binding domain-containing protein [Burkholderiales bacterium]